MRSDLVGSSDALRFVAELRSSHRAGFPVPSVERSLLAPLLASETKGELAPSLSAASILLDEAGALTQRGVRRAPLRSSPPRFTSSCADRDRADQRRSAQGGTKFAPCPARSIAHAGDRRRRRWRASAAPPRAGQGSSLPALAQRRSGLRSRSASVQIAVIGDDLLVQPRRAGAVTRASRPIRTTRGCAPGPRMTETRDSSA